MHMSLILCLIMLVDCWWWFLPTKYIMLVGTTALTYEFYCLAGYVGEDAK